VSHNLEGLSVAKDSIHSIDFRYQSFRALARHEDEKENRHPQEPEFLVFSGKFNRVEANSNGFSSCSRNLSS
jgi:hypothetical protein